jgi:hypothetical protein
MRALRAAAGRALYRTRQAGHALYPRLDANELARARSLLNEGEARLFFAMERRDQRHALEVCGRLIATGVESPALLKAALLHDCGKGAVPVWLRVANVLSPWLVHRLASEGPGLRGAAYRLVNHGEIGVRLLEAAGSSPAVIRLVLGRVEAHESDALARLRAADDAS